MSDPTSGKDPADGEILERWFVDPEALSEEERQLLRAPRLREQIAELEAVAAHVERLGDAERQAILGEASEVTADGRVRFGRDGVPFYDPRAVGEDLSSPSVRSDPMASKPTMWRIGLLAAAVLVVAALSVVSWWPVDRGGNPRPGVGGAPVLLGTDLGLRAEWSDGSLLVGWARTDVGDAVTVGCVPVGEELATETDGPRVTCYRGERTWTFTAQQLDALPSRFDVILQVVNPTDPDSPQQQRLTLSVR